MKNRRIVDPIKRCKRCGKQFWRKRYSGRLEDRTGFLNRKFCSLHCANMRGLWGKSSTAHHRYSQKFRKKRCESCGTRQHLHVHHINENWTDHRKKNLKTLCIVCHLQGPHKRISPPCRVCGKKSRRRRMCQKHFQRWKKYGNPSLTRIRKVGTPNNFVTVFKP